MNYTEFEMYLDNDGTLGIVQKNKLGKDIFFECKIKLLYHTEKDDLDYDIDEHILNLKKSIAKKFNIEIFK